MNCNPKITLSITVLVMVIVVVIVLALTPIIWSCSSTTQKNKPNPDVHSIFLITWVEEPMNWTTAAATCHSENPTKSMRLASLNSERMEFIHANILRANISGSAGIWTAKTGSGDDSSKLCPAISISSHEWGTSVHWDAVEDCGHLLGGIICEGSYTWGSGGLVGTVPTKCFGTGLCSVIFGD